MMLLENWSSPDEIFSCDACLSGCGGIMQASYFHEEFPPFIKDQNLPINALELLTIVVALKLWGPRLRGKKVLIYCDNMSSCHLVNRGCSRDEFHQSCLREICFFAARFEFIIRCQHIKTDENRVADILSRWHKKNDAAKLFWDSVTVTNPEKILVCSDLFRFSNSW